MFAPSHSYRMDVSKDILLERGCEISGSTCADNITAIVSDISETEVISTALCEYEAVTGT